MSLAIIALQHEIQRIAFDANLFDGGFAHYPYAEKCSQKRKKLLREIETLENRQMSLFEAATPESETK